MSRDLTEQEKALINKPEPVVDEWMELLHHNRERRIRLVVRPKPRFCPARLWVKIVSRVIILREMPVEDC